MKTVMLCCAFALMTGCTYKPPVPVVPVQEPNLGLEEVILQNGTKCIRWQEGVYKLQADGLWILVK